MIPKRRHSLPRYSAVYCASDGSYWTQPTKAMTVATEDGDLQLGTTGETVYQSKKYDVEIIALARK